VIVKSVEKGAVNEIGWPDHGGRIDEDSPRDAGEAIARAESRDTE